MKFVGWGEGVGCRTSGERRLALNVTCHSRLARDILLSVVESSVSIESVPRFATFHAILSLENPHLGLGVRCILRGDP